MPERVRRVAVVVVVAVPVDADLAVGLKVVAAKLALLEAAGAADAVRQLDELVDLALFPR